MITVWYFPDLSLILFLQQNCSIFLALRTLWVVRIKPTCTMLGNLIATQCGNTIHIVATWAYVKLVHEAKLSPKLN